MTDCINWLTTNWLEVVGVLSGLLFLYFEYKENWWLWITGIATSALYIVIFFQNQFYADMALQVYYVLISFYGLYRWYKPKNEEKEEKLQFVSAKVMSGTLVVSFALWAILYWVLNTFTDSPVSLGDSFTSAFGITATWMLTHKYVEQWLVWVVVNFVAVGLYAFRGMELTAFLYVVYGVIAIAGYIEWRKKALNQN